MLSSGLAFDRVTFGRPCRLTQFIAALVLTLAFSYSTAQAKDRPPTVSITSPASGTAYTVAQSVVITASASDDVGVQRVDFYDGSTLKQTVTAPPYTYAWSITQAVNGTHKWTARATDTNNRTTTSSVVTLSVNIVTTDTTPPIPGLVTASGTQVGGFISSPFTLITTFTDNESPVTGCEYTTTGTTWSPATVSGASPTFTCTKSGITGTNGQFLTLNMRATSSGGTGTATALTRTVDAAAPTTTSNAATAWVTSDQTVTLTPSDGSGAGVASTQFCTDSTNTCTPAASGTSVAVTCAAGAACQTYVRFRSTDRLGNVEATHSALVRIDKAAPTGGTLSATQGNAQVTLNWSGFADSGSGLAASAPYKLVFSASGSPTVSCTADAFAYSGSSTTFTHTDLMNGVTYYYRLCASDTAGNVSGGATASAMPQAANDTTPPIPGVVAASGTQSGGFISSLFTLTTTFTDNESAVTRCEYTVDGATWLAATVSGSGPTFTCTKSGITGTNGQFLTLNMRATSSGGTGTATALTRTVDAAAPTTTNNAATAWVTSDQTVTLTPSDGSGSGVASTQFCTDSTNTCTPAASGTSVAVTCAAGAACQTYVRFRSTDQLGNVEATHSALVRIDKAAPTGGTLSATQGNAQVTLNWSGFADSGSGLAASAPYKLVFSASGSPFVSCTADAFAYSGSSTTFTHTGLMNGVTYYYRLCASDTAGNVSVGATASAMPQAVVSAMPTLVGFVPAVANAKDVVVNSATGVAYVASAEFGLSVVNVTNPSQPVVIGAANPPFYGARVAVSGTLAAVGAGNGAGLHIVDLSVPAEPSTVGFVSGTIQGVALAGRYAYALQFVAGNPGHTDLLVVDLIVPTSPATVGRVTLAGGLDVALVGSLAYVATGTAGLQIVDVSAPTAPQIIATLDTPGNASGVSVANGYAYIADGSSIIAIDVHTPSSPFIAGSLAMSAATALKASGNRVYVIDGLQLKVLDISNPTAPMLLGASNNFGAQRVDGTGALAFLASSNSTPGLWIENVSVPSNPTVLANLYGGSDNTGVAVTNSLAAVTGSSLGLKVVDFSNPSAPISMGSLSGNMRGVAMAGQFAYVLQLIAGNPAHTDLIVVDLGVPSAPTIVSRLTLGPVGAAIKVVGSLAYVAAGTSGLQIVDISAPNAPRLVGTADTPGTASGVAVANGYAYVADTSALVVIDVHNSTSPFVVGSLSTAATAVAAVGSRAYVIAGLQFQIIDATAPAAPVLLSAWSSQGASAVDAAGTQAFLARPAVDHYDVKGGVYILDVSVPTQVIILEQVIVPGSVRSVISSNGFLYAGDGVASLDVIDLVP